MIARAKVRVLKCIMVVFECDARTNAKTVMASNECAMYSQYRTYQRLTLCSSVCALVDLTSAVKLNVRRQVIKTESARRWSNKWTKTLYQDYLHCIANFCRALLIIFSKQFISSNTKRRKRMLNFV